MSLELNKKTMLKNRPKRINKSPKTWLPNRSQKLTGFSGWRLLGHAQTARFWASKVGPQRSPNAHNDWKISQTLHQGASDCEKELQKPSLFEAWPGGLREALTIKMQKTTRMQIMYKPTFFPSSNCRRIDLSTAISSAENLENRETENQWPVNFGQVSKGFTSKYKVAIPPLKSKRCSEP